MREHNYELGNIVVIQPDTDSWIEAEHYANMNSQNQWRVEDFENDDYDGELDIYVENVFTDGTIWVGSFHIELYEEPEDLTRTPTIGDRVTWVNYQQIINRSENYNISEEEVVGTIESYYQSRTDAVYIRWDYDSERLDVNMLTDVKLIPKNHKVTPQPITTFTQQYPFTKQVLDDMYGENYDIIEEELPLNRLCADIILKFPEVIIKNKNNESHRIKDLYVKLEIKNNKLRRGLKGFRGKLSAKEYQAQYAHSHLSSSNTRSIWTNFCLGSGTETVVSLTDCSESFTEDNFMLLLAMIDSYVEYESLEGGPHINMSSINTSRNSNNGISSSIITMEHYNLKNQIRERIPLKYIHDDHIPSFEIDTNSKELDVVMNKYISVKNLRNKTNGEILDTNRSQLDVVQANRELKEDYNCSIIFKGETIQKIVEEEISLEEIDMSVYEEVANPQVVQGVLNLLKADLDKFIVG